MKLLFLTHPYPNYVPDLLLHGLRKLLGADVVDVPRKDCLYNGVLGLGICPPNQLCPGWFPPDRGESTAMTFRAKSRAAFSTMSICDLRAFRHVADCPVASTPRGGDRRRRSPERYHAGQLHRMPEGNRRVRPQHPVADGAAGRDLQLDRFIRRFTEAILHRVPREHP